VILLVIGASSDMGMAYIENEEAEYEYIIAHYLHMNDKLALLKSKLGDRLMLVCADLSMEEDVLRMIEKIKEENLIPDHIIHFAAPLCNNQKFHKIKWETYEKEMDISLKSAILVLQEFLPRMARKHYGRVVIMLSFVVNNAAPAYCSNYVVTKYALLGLVKALASEYASKGITVNGISPSWVETKYITNQPDILREQNAVNSPIGRNLQVDEILPSIKYLLSEGASCVNGQNIVISCGR
jgi:3-oxoacyl-[acyl-carrier protein] reductase